MEVVKITIYANKKKVHQLYPGDEVEQTLMIETNGHISFDSTFYGGGYGQYFDGRHESFYINGNDAFDIVKYVSVYFARHGSWGVIPGLGSWHMTMTDSEGKNYDYYGSLTGAQNELTYYIRDRVPLSGICVFSQNPY